MLSLGFCELLASLPLNLQRVTAKQQMWCMDDAHPQVETYRLFRRQRPVIPLYYGPLPPLRRRDPTQFARLMLLLFKPFRKPSDLLGGFSSWDDAFEDFQSTAPPRV